MKTLFARLFIRKPEFARSAVRHGCRIEAELALTDSEVRYEGRLINLSLGGAMFRPRLAHLMSRSSTPIRLTVGDMAMTGELVATTPQGFGLRFDRALSEGELDKWLELDASGQGLAA